MPFQDRYADLDLKIHYRDYPCSNGGADPVLCLHGLTRNCRDFHNLALWLQDRHRVIAPDMRGRGLSEYDPQWRRYQPSTYVEDVFQLLELLGLQRVVVIGTSLGGLMAMLMAHRRPEFLSAVVLNDVGPELAPEGIARIMTYVGVQPSVTNWKEAADQCRQADAHGESRDTGARRSRCRLGKALAGFRQPLRRACPGA